MGVRKGDGVNTYLVFLLVSVGIGHFGNGAQPSATLATFQTAQDCEDVRKQLLSGYPDSKPRLQCVSAKVAVLK